MPGLDRSLTIVTAQDICEDVPGGICISQAEGKQDTTQEDVLIGGEIKEFAQRTGPIWTAHYPLL